MTINNVLKQVAKGLFLLVILFPYAGSPGASESRTIYFTNGEWSPYTSRDLKDFGLISKIVTEAFKTVDIRVRYDFYPWSRGYAYLLKKNEKYNGSLGYVWSEKRAEKMYFSEPLYRAKAGFFHLKTVAFDWEHYHDLKRVRIGTTLGYQYSTGFETARKEGILHVEQVGSDLQNFKKLLRDRIDIFPSNLDVGYYILTHQFSKKEQARITHHPKLYHEDNLYAIFPKTSPRSKQLIQKLNTGLEHLRASGRYLQIQKEYGLAFSHGKTTR